MSQNVQQQRYVIQGMHCAGCAARIQKAVAAVPGVNQPSVNFASQTLTFEADNARRSAVVDAVLALGYQIAEAPRLPEDHRARREAVIREQARLWRDFCLAALFTLPLWLSMLPALLPAVLPSLWPVTATIKATLGSWHLPGGWSLLLAAPVQFVFGLPFYRGAWQAARARTATMDTLVALGTSVAFFYSLILWLVLPSAHHGQLYFESSATVITLVSLGRWLEGRARVQAVRSLDLLSVLQPVQAQVWREGRWQTLPVAAVRLDDRVLVRPGEAIPVDGEVVDGDSEVEEALLTGESLPQRKRLADRVVAGSINGDGALTLRVTAVGDGTALAHIIRWVENAQASRAPIQQMVDRISEVFVPAVLGLALLTWLGWGIGQGEWAHGLMAAVSVLVIACPCALGLATPMAMTVCADVAARHGILLRDVDVLERAASVSRVIFDKTGTVTQGHAQVTQVLSLSGTDIYWMSLVASLSAWSEHPYARALRQYGVDHELPARVVHGYRNSAGRGMAARVDGRDLLVGNRVWMQENRIPLTARTDEAFNRLAAEGSTILWVAMDGQVQGFCVLVDPVRTDAVMAVEQLHRMGLQTGMLSGDSRPVVQAVAADLGLDSALAECLPEDKAKHIAALQAGGIRVVMVGDGINDAPALAQADLSMAIGSGTDVANRTAGISLMRSNLVLVPWALSLARAGRRKIRENLFWAFVFNALGIPLAAFGQLNPGLAGAAMALSSVAVVGNALLLQRWQPPR